MSLTVLGHLQDVADQRAVPIEGLGPRQVDGPLLRGAECRHWVLGGVGELPGGKRCGGVTCEVQSQVTDRQPGLGLSFRETSCSAVELGLRAIYLQILLSGAGAHLAKADPDSLALAGSSTQLGEMPGRIPGYV